MKKLTLSAVAALKTACKDVGQYTLHMLESGKAGEVNCKMIGDGED